MEISVKNQGNEFLLNQEFDRAIECYTKVINTEEDEAVAVICYSNRSNAYFEKGLYTESIADARACLKICDDPRLKKKNMMRLARASICMNQFETAVSELKKLIKCCQQNNKDQYFKRSKKLLVQLKFYSSKRPSLQSLTQASLPLNRAALSDPAVEYFRFGHDPATSAASGLSMHCDSPIDILFGGVGDARHALVTLMDLEKNLETSPKIQFLLNDINAACMARNVLQFTLLWKLGVIASSYDQISRNKLGPAAKICTLLQYMFLGYVMPRTVHNHLLQVIEELVHLNHTEFATRYPWFPYTSPKDWAQVQAILSYWYTTDCRVGDAGDAMPPPEYHDCSWPPVPDMPKMRKKFELPQKTNMANFATRDGGDMEIETMEKIKEGLDMFRINTIEQLNLAKVANPDDPDSYDDMKTFFENASYDILDSYKRREEECPVRNRLEIRFLEKTKALLPPSEECGQEEVFQTIHSLDEKDGTRRFDRMATRAKGIILKSWVPNPIMIDPSFQIPHLSDPHRFHPMNEFFDFYLREDTLSSMKDPIDPSLREHEFFDLTSNFYWNVAYALNSLIMVKKTLTIEWSIDSIMSLCRSIQDNSDDRLDMGKPVTFQRIFASNIPDNTGLLPFITEVMPCLDEPSEMNVPVLRTNIHLNTGIWENYSHYVYSSTAIPDLTQIELLLGIKCIGEDSAWEDHQWAWNKHMTYNTNKEDLRLWLQRVFFNIVIPSQRDKHAMIQEVCSQTIPAFLRMCDHCVSILGYPKHWVNSILDELLAKDSIETKAQLPKSFPNKFHPENDLHVVNLSAFRYDLRLHVAIWLLDDANNYLVPVETLNFPTGPIYEYEIEANICEVNGDPESVKELGASLPKCLGLLLEENYPKDQSAGTNDISEIAQSFEKMFDSTTSRSSRSSTSSRRDSANYSNPLGYRTSIRPKLMIGEDNTFTILSCIRWNSTSNDDIMLNRVRFVIPESDFVNFKHFYVSLLRTDSWNRVGRPICLGAARVVGQSAYDNDEHDDT